MNFMKKGVLTVLFTELPSGTSTLQMFNRCLLNELLFYDSGRNECLDHCNMCYHLLLKCVSIFGGAGINK